MLPTRDARDPIFQTQAKANIEIVQDKKRKINLNNLNQRSKNALISENTVLNSDSSKIIHASFELIDSNRMMLQTS